MQIQQCKDCRRRLGYEQAQKVTRLAGAVLAERHLNKRTQTDTDPDNIKKAYRLPTVWTPEEADGLSKNHAAGSNQAISLQQTTYWGD